MARETLFSRLSAFRTRAAARSVVRCESLEARQLLSTVSFAAAVTTQTATVLNLVKQTAVGDLNGDGIPDLVALGTSTQAQVFLGTKTGAFTPGQFYSTGGLVIGLGAFDTSANNTLDLVTANGILLGNGDGTFGSPLAGFALPANTVNVYTQDVNGDGNFDIVCATLTTPASGNPQLGATVLLGLGNGTFKAPVSTNIGSAAGLTAADAVFSFGDFNGDGKPDLVSAFGTALGNGDGTFGTSTPLPFKTPATSTATPVAPEFAVADFSGDGNLDIATLPAGGSLGQAEVFFGNGKGQFTDNGTVTISSGSTITSLASADLNGDGTPDLIAGVSNSSGTSVAVLLNAGKGVLGSPAFYNTPSAPLNIETQDFNLDGTLDLLTINQVPSSINSSLSSSASVLLGAVNAGSSASITLHSSASPSIAGASITLTSAVIAPSGATAAAPTGNVTFFDGTTSLGSAPLDKTGRATLTATLTGIGIHTLTAAYAGDGVYASVTSAAVSQVVLASSARTPLIIPSAITATLPQQFLPQDKGTLTITLINGGNAPAAGTVAVTVYLSTTGAIDSSAIALNIPSLARKSVQLARGRTTNLLAHFTAGAYPVGAYFLVAQVAAISKLTADEVSNQPIFSATTFNAVAASTVFGTIGTHKGIKFRYANPGGGVSTLSLIGPGSGTAVQGTNGLDVTITGTTTASTFTVSGKSALTLDTLDDSATLNAIAAGQTSVLGALRVPRGVKKVTLSSLGIGAASPIPVTLGNFSPQTITLGTVGDVALASTSQIHSLTAGSWAAGSLTASSIVNLKVRGAFGANISLASGGSIKSATLGAITGGVWAIPAGINLLKVIGDVTSADIYAGASAGPDGILGTADDTFSAALFGSLTIGGNVASSLFIAGGSFPVTSGLALSSLTLLKGGVFHTVTVKGTADPSTHFLAAKLPKTAKIAGATIKTATDPRFLP